MIMLDSRRLYFDASYCCSVVAGGKRKFVGEHDSDRETGEDGAFVHGDDRQERSPAVPFGGGPLSSYEETDNSLG